MCTRIEIWLFTDRVRRPTQMTYCTWLFFCLLFPSKKPSRRPMIDRTRGIKGFRPWNPRLGSPVLCRGSEGECERMANKITVSLWLLNGLELSLSLNQLEMFYSFRHFKSSSGVWRYPRTRNDTRSQNDLWIISHQLIMPWPSVTASDCIIR